MLKGPRLPLKGVTVGNAANKFLNGTPVFVEEQHLGTGKYLAEKISKQSIKVAAWIVLAM